jgi:hypothetical protein
LTGLPTKIEDIVVFIRTKYFLVKEETVIAIYSSNSLASVQRYVIYFFVRPTLTEGYKVYRVVVDYNTETIESRIFIKTFQLYIEKNVVVKNAPTNGETQDIEIAFGYESFDISKISENENIKNVLRQIENKYKDLTKSKSLRCVEFLELKDGRINYKIVYVDESNPSASVKFVVFYQPKINKILVLNPVALGQSSQYQEMSAAEQTNDEALSKVIQQIGALHPSETKTYSLLCVSKGKLEKETEYHVTLGSNGKKYKAVVKVSANNVDLREVSFAEVSFVSLDHYRYNEFEKLYISNFQKLSDADMKTDANFRLVYDNVVNKNKVRLDGAKLIGAANKPSSLGFIYHVIFRLANTEIITFEIYLESYTLKVVQR